MRLRLRVDRGRRDGSPLRAAGGRRCTVRWRGPKGGLAARGRPRRRGLTGEPLLFHLLSEWIRQAVSWGFSNHRFLSVHNRFFAPLHDDPRFQALVATAREKERIFEV